MKLPEQIRLTIRERVWSAAESIGWDALSPQERARQYENWTGEPEVGGVLMRYMDKARIRVYLKDSVLKHFSRARTSDAARPLRALRIDPAEPVRTELAQPHGRVFDDGRVVCWGRADEWKHILMALHERTYGHPTLRPFGAVLMAAAGRFHEAAMRSLVEDAARRLGIQNLVWLDT
jgi:hypothetical protein